MERNRIVAGLDVHKDSVFLCIMRHDEAIIFEKTYGKDSNKKCNGHSPHSFSGEGRAPGIGKLAVIW